jgi:RecA/RadA recombinase
MSNFLKDMVKTTGNEFASIVEDGIDGGDVTGFVDTGVYALNALLSGSLYGGMPANKIMALAGESATGKTFFALSIVKTFLEANPDGVCMYFDSEAAVTSDMFRTRNIDTRRVAVIGVATVEEFRNQAVKVVDNYLKMPVADRKPMIMILDSLGMLSSSKEMNDTAEGKDTRDMTRAQVTKATFRVLTLKLGKAGIPLIMTNHTYETMSMFPQKIMGGGCLTEGHKVQMSDGTFKDISDINKNDTVITMFGNRQVLETFKYENKPTVSIEMEDGYTVVCTPEHKFLVKQSDELVWIKAEDLTESDDLVVMD